MCSFQKRGKNAVQHPKGTRPSAFNAQLLCSFGLSEMDNVISGGRTFACATRLTNQGTYEQPHKKNTCNPTILTGKLEIIEQSQPFVWLDKKELAVVHGGSTWHFIFLHLFVRYLASYCVCLIAQGGLV